MTIMEYNNTQVPKAGPSDAEVPGGIVTSNNNMNSRVNKQLGQLPENLRLNGRTPSGKPRLFVCQVCTRAFARQEHLTRHERSHTKEKPYCCGICNRKFSRRDLLLRHAHKIHGGNYGDTILKRDGQKEQQQQQQPQLQQNTSSNKVVKKKHYAPSASASLASRHKVKRRTSYSAQSGSYVAPSENQETHKFDRVKFSTPELLPIDLKGIDEEGSFPGGHTVADGLRNGHKNNNYNNITNSDNNVNIHSAESGNNSRQNQDINASNIEEESNAIFPEIPNLTLSTPNEFNLLDQVNWINDYNEHTMPFPGSATNTGTGTETAIPTTDSTGSDNSPRSLTYSALPNRPSPAKNVRNSSWSINGADGGLQIKSLFMNGRSPSYTTPDHSSSTPLVKRIERSESEAANNTNLNNNGILKTDNGDTVNLATIQANPNPNPDKGKNSDWFKVSSLSPSGTSSSKGNNDNGNGSINNQDYNTHNSQPYIRPDNEMNELTYLTKEVQSIFSKFIQDEETNICDEAPQYESNNSRRHVQDIVTSGDGFEGVSVNNPQSNRHRLANHATSNSSPLALNHNYSFYGIDYLSLSNISRASPPNDFELRDLPPSKLFTPSLREMCLTALKYYNLNCQNNGMDDPILSSKDLVLPSCNELNCFVSYFQEYFNSHHSFIHPDFFNLDLQSLKRYVREDSDNVAGCSDNHYSEESDAFVQHSNIACLPLFVATVGSLYKIGCNSKTMELYEISRRILHVYLERRKEQKQKQQDSSRDSKAKQKVWLIQSLILSIIFVLFDDYSERVDGKMIKRQVSAVCSIVRNNFLNVISHSYSEKNNNSNGFANVPEFGTSNFSNFDSSIEYIMFESKIRTSLLVYEFCQFLKIFYHVDCKYFLTEHDLDAICVPDDEFTWRKASLLMPMSFMIKKYTNTFQTFYHSFSFNNSGMHPIPEVLAKAMLLYEFNASTFSTFHVFLTRIDTKKLERNMAVTQPHIDFADENRQQQNYFSILASDAVKVRNFLMTMVFFSKIDLSFSSKIWNGQLVEVYDHFLNSRNFNVLTKGSYSLLTDFLVALNFSIKNVATLLKLSNSGTIVELDKNNLSMFNLQGYYYDFLVIIKFINDFEFTPNFKLLCIYTELKKLANNLLIPHFSTLYPGEFAKFEDIIVTSELLQQHTRSDLKTCFSTIDTDRLEKLINNVLIYSFNDASFLNMADQTNNEFPFNNDYPTYLPNVFSSENATNIPTGGVRQNLAGQEESESQSVRWFNEQNNVNDALNMHPISDNLASKSSLDLLLSRNNTGNTTKQCFADRYHLSDKYVCIAVCFMKNVKEYYAHSHILDKMVKDFKQLEKCLDDGK